MSMLFTLRACFYFVFNSLWAYHTIAISKTFGDVIFCVFTSFTWFIWVFGPNLPVP